MDNKIEMVRIWGGENYEYEFKFLDLSFSGREPNEAYAHVEHCAELVRDAQALGGFQPFETAPLFRAYAIG